VVLASIALLVAQGTATFPNLAPEWVPAPALAETEYGHFSRHVPNGPDEVLIGTARVCDCDPRSLADSLVHAFDDKPLAVIQRETIPACGRNVQHVVVVGVADVTGRKNLDLYAFRNADSLVVISFLFTKAAPSAEDEAAMQAICPAVPASTS
jgi:hypothetical protein